MVKAESGRGVSTPGQAYPVHNAPAGNPQRTAPFVPPHEEARVNVGIDGEAVGVTSQNDTSAPIPVVERAQPQMAPPGLRTSPPPVSPEKESEIQSLQAQVGELTRAIGDMNKRDKDREQEMAQTRFQMQTNALAAGQRIPGGFVPAALPENVKATDPVQVGQFLDIFNQALPRIEQAAVSQAIRASWNVTVEEEQQALASYPDIERIPEPARTSQILEAVRMLRSAGSAPSPSTPVSAAPASAPLAVQSAPPTVPQPEQSQAPMVGEPQTVNVRAAALAAYEQAKAMPATTKALARERTDRMRDAWTRINQIDGQTEEHQKLAKFHQKL